MIDDDYNAVAEAREIMGAEEFGELLRVAMESDGVVICEPRLFVAAWPVAEGVLYVGMIAGSLPLLRELLLPLGYKRVRWVRHYKYGSAYAERERDLADFCRHEDFGTGLTKVRDNG